jgi:hypothetical protein
MEFGIAVIDDTVFSLGGIQDDTLRNAVEMNGLLQVI